MRILTAIGAALTLAACTVTNDSLDGWEQRGSFPGIASVCGIYTKAETKTYRVYVAASAEQGKSKPAAYDPPQTWYCAEKVVALEAQGWRAAPGYEATSLTAQAIVAGQWRPLINPPPANFGSVSLTGAQPPEVRRGPMRPVIAP